MAKVSREILKSFFQSGSRPTAANFNMLIDSLLHYAEDREITGLKEYNPANTYMQGDAVINASVIYQALIDTTGEFKSNHWKKISDATSVSQPVAAAFGSDYVLVEEMAESFSLSASAMATKLSISTGTRTGTYRIAWQAAVRHQQSGGLGRFQLLNATASILIGSSLVIKQNSNSEKIPVGGFSKMNLNGNDQLIELQYQTLDAGMGQYIEDAKIELLKISD